MVYQVGDKVVPHNKMKGSSLAESVVWRMARELNQPYLYITHIDGEKVTLGIQKHNYEDGDYFLMGDFTLFDKDGLHSSEKF